VKMNQPSLYAQVKNLPRCSIPAGDRQRPWARPRGAPHPPGPAVAAGLAFPHAAQATRVTHQIRPFSSTSKWRTDLTGLRAAPCRLAPDWLHTVAPLAPVRITNVVLLWIRVKARSV
jgi:hypothetical protein